ncbi:MAG: hypothetical protein JXQ73_22290 [Phycisphaerae bacterium]|nr:hypothetical protein [Phycisphaerae bacterium]
MTRTSVFVAFIASTAGVRADVQFDPVKTADGLHVRLVDGKKILLSPIDANSGLIVIQPTGTTPVRYAETNQKDGVTTLTGGKATGLSLSETWKQINPNLIERAVSVTAHSDQRHYLELGWRAATTGDFYSFTGREPATKAYSPGCAGPEFKQDSRQTFPMLGYRVDDRFFGLIGDTPGLWENRCFMTFDVDKRRLSLTTGDGSARRVISIPRGVDATSVYRAAFDGWQHIEIGQTQTYKTWIFDSPAKSLYDVQLAAHIALANAKGFNRSGLEAILRNTSYLLLRRNLLRPESDYIFISGTGYGWKQWVSDGFWMSRGLDDPRYDAEAQAAVFYERVDYEDNAQYYLIWSMIVKKAGGDIDPRTVRRAYEFIRKHEVDGLYVPPRLTSDRACMKTYHDQLPYDDDDAPSSNQGFHCGALLAARELGFKVTDAEIDKAIAGYARMFNTTGGYFATSLKQQQHVGQDALYGEVLTYAVFGRKLLPDDMVRKHLETTMKIQTPYGMRVISKPNGDLLDGHSGAYVFGGSWFLNDAANYLDGLIHGMDPNWVDDKLLWRLEKELAWMPAFHESLNTKTGKPYGHHLYSWNSGFWWLRREVRAKLGMTGPDPLEPRLDKLLGITKHNNQLALDPSSATLRPKE